MENARGSRRSGAWRQPGLLAHPAGAGQGWSRSGLLVRTLSLSLSDQNLELCPLLWPLILWPFCPLCPFACKSMFSPTEGTQHDLCFTACCAAFVLSRSFPFLVAQPFHHETVVSALTGSPFCLSASGCCIPLDEMSCTGVLSLSFFLDKGHTRACFHLFCEPLPPFVLQGAGMVSAIALAHMRSLSWPRAAHLHVNASMATVSGALGGVAAGSGGGVGGGRGLSARSPFGGQGQKRGGGGGGAQSPESASNFFTAEN